MKIALRCGRGRSVRRALAMIGTLAVALPPLAGSSPAAAAEPMPPVRQAGRAQVLAGLGIGAQGADYVIVVDTSGSMAGRYPGIERALRGFLRAVRPDDRVALVSFKGRGGAEVNYPASRVSDPAAVIAALPPAGGRTAIGDGLDKAIAELERPDARPAAAVLLFTDAVDNETTARSWDGLIARLDRLRRRQVDGVPVMVRGYIMDWTQRGTGAKQVRVGTKPCLAADAKTIMRCVFSPQETTEVPTQGTTEFLNRLPTSFTDRRLHQRLAADALAVRSGSAVAVRLPSGLRVDPKRDAIDIPVRITSHTQYLPLRVGDITASFAGIRGARLDWTGPSWADLKPGASSTLLARVSWAPHTDKAWYAAGSRGLNARVFLTAQLASPYSEVMSGAPTAQGRFAPSAARAESSLTAPPSTAWRVQRMLAVLFGLLLALVLVTRYLGLPTVVWVVDRRPGGGSVAFRQWLPRVSVHRLPSPGDSRTEITISWARWRRLAGAPVDVVLWPTGRADDRNPHRARHPIALARRHRPVEIDAAPDLTFTHGWRRPKRAKPTQ